MKELGYGQQSVMRGEQEINPQLNKITAEEQNRASKPKLKLLGFILLYTIVILAAKKAATVQLIVVDPPIDVPQDFIEQVSNATVSFKQFEQMTQIHNQVMNIVEKQLGQNIDITQEDQVYVDTNGLDGCVVVSLVCLLVHLTLSFLSAKSVAIQIYEKDAEKEKYGFVFVR